MSLERDIGKVSQRKKNPKDTCAICREPIVGKAWRIDDNNYACTRCNNEKPAT